MDDATFKNAIISGCNNIRNNESVINELNVFPVPDGDTGTNMSMTSYAAVSALDNLLRPSFKLTAKTVSQAMLRGARGNSGVILSLIFRGIYKSLKGESALTVKSFVKSLDCGVKEAYGAVMNPTEGTILTVAKDVCCCGFKNDDKEFAPFFETIVDCARKSLQNTPNLLPTLKKAGVVDAGGKGLVCFLEGMKEVVVNGRSVETETTGSKRTVKDPVAASSDKINFAYCTEYIINLKEPKDELKLRAYLESIGDCVVVVADDEIIKVHVHTNRPGDALNEGIKYGYLTDLKIDNMQKQHKDKKTQAQNSLEYLNYVPVDENTDMGFVAVAAGGGVKNLFKEIGADVVVDGGQTMNPSAQDLLTAIHNVGAKTVFVLPNNKNIIMAAEQAASMADREVKVIQTKTVPQGMASMLAYDSSAGVKENEIYMTKAADGVKTGLVTFAARDSIYEGKQIGKNEILALMNGRIVLTEKTVLKAAFKLMKKMVDSTNQFATVFYGSEVSSEQADELYEMLQSKFSDRLEINLVKGEQPVYYYIISVE